MLKDPMQTTAGRSATPRPGSRPGVLASFESTALDRRLCEQVTRALESNRIVHFPRSPVPLPDADALEFLRVQLPPLLPCGNVSYHVRARRLLGLKAERPQLERTTAILRGHLKAVSEFLQQLMPRQCEGWTIVKASFRPLQERGRNLKPQDSNELVHIDAGAGICDRATNGDRILRFFINLNEQEDRVWNTQGTIQDVLDRHGISSGLLDRAGRLRVRLTRQTSDRARSFAVGALAIVNPLARQLDSSPYDRAMRKLHRYMKDSERFKVDRVAYEQLRFPPGSAWMAFTDGVTHASVSGRFALVSTFVLRRRSLHHEHFSPYHLLEMRS
jgi:hypothetical protein